MESQEITIGMRVRYPRTGTTGTVMRLEREKGEMFAELDSTGLLYRVDNLVPAAGSEKHVETRAEDLKEQLQKERFFESGLEMGEAIKDLDQSCEGGG
jgi:hypothetical protein